MKLPASQRPARSRLRPDRSEGVCMCAQVYARLVGCHKAAVTKLQVLGSKEENGHDLLLSAGADGSVAVWEPASAAPSGPDKERLPKVTTVP